MNITLTQVRRAVNKLALYKAPGSDEINNKVLKNTLTQIELHLQTLVQASLNLGHFLKPFKATTTVVLRKLKNRTTLKQKHIDRSH